MSVTGIHSAVLDWTLCQPLPITMPEDATILSVKYHSYHDHLYFSANPNGKKVVREFVCGMTGSVFEPIHGKEHVYLGTTIDEESRAWHIFELVLIKKAPITKPTSSEPIMRPTSPPPPRKR